MPCSLNSIRIFSANEVSLSSTLAIISLNSHNLVSESVLQETDAALPDFQVVIRPFDPIPDVFSDAIIIFWVVLNLYQLALFPLDVLL